MIEKSVEDTIPMKAAAELDKMARQVNILLEFEDPSVTKLCHIYRSRDFSLIQCSLYFLFVTMAFLFLIMTAPNEDNEIFMVAMVVDGLFSILPGCIAILLMVDQKLRRSATSSLICGDRGSLYPSGVERQRDDVRLLFATFAVCQVLAVGLWAVAQNRDVYLQSLAVPSCSCASGSGSGSGSGSLGASGSAASLYMGGGGDIGGGGGGGAGAVGGNTCGVGDGSQSPPGTGSHSRASMISAHNTFPIESAVSLMALLLAHMSVLKLEWKYVACCWAIALPCLVAAFLYRGEVGMMCGAVGVMVGFVNFLFSVMKGEVLYFIHVHESRKAMQDNKTKASEMRRERLERPPSRGKDKDKAGGKDDDDDPDVDPFALAIARSVAAARGYPDAIPKTLKRSAVGARRAAAAAAGFGGIPGLSGGETVAISTAAVGGLGIPLTGLGGSGFAAGDP